MAKQIINAQVLDHNIMGELASYKVMAKNLTNGLDSIPLNKEIYFEVIIRKNPAQTGGIDEDDALKILNGDEVKIEVEVSTWAPKGAYEILDIKPLKERPWHRRNLLVL